MRVRFVPLVLVLACLPLPAQEDAPSRPGSALPARPTLVVLAKSAATALLLDPETGEERARLPVGDGPHEAACSPDGTRVVVCDYGGQKPGNTLTILDPVAAKVLRTIELVREGKTETERYLRPHGVQFLADGRRVVVTCETLRRLIVVDIERGVVEQAIDTGGRASHMVALANDQRLAFVANLASGSMSVLDLEQPALLGVVETGKGSEGIAARPGANEVWVGNREADTLSIVDPLEKTELAELACGAFPIRVAFSPDGNFAYVSCAKAGTLEVFDAAKRERVAAIAMDEAPVDDRSGERIFAGQFEDSPVPVGVLVSPDGARAYVANTQADIVTVVDLAARRVLRRLKAGPEPDGLCWVPAPRSH
ncbi:MAG: YncE family protein [Planctomycetes bacterium]|nr:YncE family protein [Planctomycetota bacterium]